MMRCLIVGGGRPNFNTKIQPNFDVTEADKERERIGFRCLSVLYVCVWLPPNNDDEDNEDSFRPPLSCVVFVHGHVTNLGQQQHVTMTNNDWATGGWVDWPQFLIQVGVLAWRIAAKYGDDAEDWRHRETVVGASNTEK